jgi:hypothetical protein
MSDRWRARQSEDEDIAQSALHEPRQRDLVRCRQHGWISKCLFLTSMHEFSLFDVYKKGIACLK